MEWNNIQRLRAEVERWLFFALLLPLLCSPECDGLSSDQVEDGVDGKRSKRTSTSWQFLADDGKTILSASALHAYFSPLGVGYQSSESMDRSIHCCPLHIHPLLADRTLRIGKKIHITINPAGRTHPIPASFILTHPLIPPPRNIKCSAQELSLLFLVSFFVAIFPLPPFLKKIRLNRIGW